MDSVGWCPALGRWGLYRPLQASPKSLRSPEHAHRDQGRDPDVQLSGTRSAAHHESRQGRVEALLHFLLCSKHKHLGLRVNGVRSPQWKALAWFRDRGPRSAGPSTPSPYVLAARIPARGMLRGSGRVRRRGPRARLTLVFATSAGRGRPGCCRASPRAHCPARRSAPAWRRSQIQTSGLFPRSHSRTRPRLRVEIFNPDRERRRRRGPSDNAQRQSALPSSASRALSSGLTTAAATDPT